MYCRKCGAPLKENARFCHRCGTQVVTYISASPPRTASKKLVSTPEIVLIAAVIATVIVVAGVFVVLTLNPVISSQENPANQTKVSSFGFKVQDGETKSGFVAVDSAGAAGFVSLSSRGLPKNSRFAPQALS